MEGIYQHFRAEEHAFIDGALEWIVQVEDQYTPRLTDFLDPRQRLILESVVGGYENIEVKFWGGVNQAERRRALIYPDYYEPSEADFQITLFDIRYPVKFTTLTHQKNSWNGDVTRHEARYIRRYFNGKGRVAIFRDG